MNPYDFRNGVTNFVRNTAAGMAYFDSLAYGVAAGISSTGQDQVALFGHHPQSTWALTAALLCRQIKTLPDWSPGRRARSCG